MQNLILSSIDSEKLICDISEKVTAKILEAVTSKPTSVKRSEKLLTIKEAAEFLNLTVPTLYSKVHKRTIPFMKKGKRLYFSSVELMNYIKEGKCKTDAELEKEAESYLSNLKNGSHE